MQKNQVMKESGRETFVISEPFWQGMITEKNFIKSEIQNKTQKQNVDGKITLYKTGFTLCLSMKKQHKRTARKPHIKASNGNVQETKILL